MKYVWRCIRRLKKAERTLIKSSVDFGSGDIGIFLKGLIYDFYSKFGSVFLIFFILSK